MLTLWYVACLLKQKLNLASVFVSWGVRQLRKRVALSYLVQLSSVRFWVKAPEAADSQLFFLSSRAGRGNTCSVAAGFKEGKDDNGSLTACLQNMGKESKVRISDINTRQKHLDLKKNIFNNICTLFWTQRGFLLLFFFMPIFFVLRL